MDGERAYEMTRLLALDMGIKLPMFYELAVTEQIAWDELAHEQNLKDMSLTLNPDNGTLPV